MQIQLKQRELIRKFSLQLQELEVKGNENIKTSVRTHDGNGTSPIRLHKCKSWQLTGAIPKVRIRLITLIMPSEGGHVTQSLKTSLSFWRYLLHGPRVLLCMYEWMNECWHAFLRWCRRSPQQGNGTHIQHTVPKFPEKGQEVAEFNAADDSPRPLFRSGCRLAGSQWAGHWMPMRKTHPELDRRRSGRVRRHSRQQ